MQHPWDSLRDGHRLITPQLQSKPSLAGNGETPNTPCCSSELLVKVLQQFLSKSCNEVGCCCSPPMENGALQQRCEMILKFTTRTRNIFPFTARTWNIFPLNLVLMKCSVPIAKPSAPWRGTKAQYIQAAIPGEHFSNTANVGRLKAFRLSKSRCVCVSVQLPLCGNCGFHLHSQGKQRLRHCHSLKGGDVLSLSGEWDGIGTVEAWNSTACPAHSSPPSCSEPPSNVALGDMGVGTVVMG